MGAGGEAGRPDSPDDLALFHARAGPNVGRDGAQMGVARPDLSGMPKLDGEKVTASDRAVGPELSLQGQPHGIAAPQVPREVHLPGEYVRDVIDQLFKVLLPEAIQVAAEASRPDARLDGAG